MTATRWQSWHAAFEEAGKAEHSLGAPHGRLILPLTGNDFAAALGEVMTTRVILMSPELHQEACRTGSLTWYDARGRCVVINRESGLARAPAGLGFGQDAEGRDLWPPNGAGPLPPFPPKGFAPPLGEPFTHPLPESPGPTPEITRVYAEDTAAKVQASATRPGLLDALKPKGKKK